MRIFLSYASQHRPEAERLSLSLRQDGHDVFFDRTSLPQSESYDNRIREALRRSDFVIFLISPESVETGSYSRSELQMCQSRFPNPSGRVLPVVISATHLETIPNYLRAVTIMEPSGDLVAEVTAQVSEVAASRRRTKLKWAITLSVVAVVVLGSVMTFFYLRGRTKSGPLEMKALKGFSMFAEPNQDSKIVRRVSAGTDLTLLPDSKSANWAKVRLSDNTEGWVMAQDMNFVESVAKKIDIAGFGFRGPYWQLFFTSPQEDKAQRNQYGIDARFADAIDKGQASLDIAVFELNSRIITDAIIEAKKRGVAVRVVGDKKSVDQPDYTFSELRDQGIPVKTDNSPGLMHDKFAILDRKVVWTGSWNYTDGATYRNNENAIVLESADIANAYTSKFNSMFEAGQFGRSRGAESSATNPSSRKLQYGVEVYFAPEDDVLSVLSEALRTAKTSITFMAFVFRHPVLGDVILNRARSGVEVRGILEKKLMSRSDAGGLLSNDVAKLQIRFDGNRYFLHHDCIIIDNEIVITGSLNFSQTAITKNNENIVVIRDRTLASKYNEEFQRLWSISQVAPAVTNQNNPAEDNDNK